MSLRYLFAPGTYLEYCTSTVPGHGGKRPLEARRNISQIPEIHLKYPVFLLNVRARLPYCFPGASTAPHIHFGGSAAFVSVNPDA